MQEEWRQPWKNEGGRDEEREKEGGEGRRRKDWPELTLNRLEAFQKLVRSFLNLVGGRHRSRTSERREGGEDDMERGGGAIKLTISERTSSGRKGRGGMIFGWWVLVGYVDGETRDGSMALELEKKGGKRCWWWRGKRRVEEQSLFFLFFNRPFFSFELKVSISSIFDPFSRDQIEKIAAIVYRETGPAPTKVS